MAHEIVSAIYSTTTEQPSEVALLARNDQVTEESAARWRRAAAIGLLPGGEPAVGVFSSPDENFLVVRAYPAPNDPDQILYSYTRVPRLWLRRINGNLTALLQHLPDDPQALIALASDDIRRIPSWETSKRLQVFQQALSHFGGDFQRMLVALNAALSPERLLISGAGESVDRLLVVQGLAALLPDCIRADLTFSTHAPNVGDLLRTRIVFSESTYTHRHRLAWNEPDSLSEVPLTAYTQLLLEFWQGDAERTLNLVEGLDPLANCIPDLVDQIDQLSQITGRFTFNRRVAAEEGAVTPDELKRALDDGDNMPQTWRRRYADLLLTHALRTKDTEANSIIAAQMDRDTELDAELQRRMDAMLNEAPDLVYVFMRQRVGEGDFGDRWLDRLHAAAEHSMDVVLHSGDKELVLSWLRLIAREPKRFDLDDVLQTGIRQSLPLARQDSEFALSVVTIAARLSPLMMERLMEMPDILQALPPPYSEAFLNYDRDALAELQQQSTSLFLAGMKQAADARAGAAFEAGVLERLWALSRDEDRKYDTEAAYTPDRILRMCAETGADWLSLGTQETFLALLLNAKDDTLLPLFIQHMSAQDHLTEPLTGALLRNGRNINHALDTISTLLGTDRLKPEEALTVYVSLLDKWGWEEDTQPIIETVARLLMQNKTLKPTVTTLTQMLQASADLRDEAGARAAALRLLESVKGKDDADFVEDVAQVFSLLAWSSTARTAVLDWWRVFVQSQPQARLSRLDQALAGVRVADDALEALRSVAAMRRFLGKRDVATFAQDVNTTYDVLETLAGAFEPDERSNSLSFEPETVRALLSKMNEELSPHQRQILSNSLKGLAELVAQMGDNRSKAGLGRRKDNLDRQLLTGEQTPQSAVDAMKWIAGYFSGAQTPDDEA